MCRRRNGGIQWQCNGTVLNPSVTARQGGTSDEIPHPGRQSQDHRLAAARQRGRDRPLRPDRDGGRRPARLAPWNSWWPARRHRRTGTRKRPMPSVHPYAPFYSLLIRVDPENPQSSGLRLRSLRRGRTEPTDGGKTYTFKVKEGVDVPRRHANDRPGRQGHLRQDHLPRPRAYRAPAKHSSTWSTRWRRPTTPPSCSP